MSVDDTPAGRILAALEAGFAGVNPLVPVYDAHVPVDKDNAPASSRYAVLWPSTGAREKPALNDRGDRVRAVRWQVTSVGESRRHCLWVAERAQTALVGIRVPVPGWQSTPADHTSSSPVRRDDDLPGRPLFVAVDTFEMTLNR